MLSAKQIAGSLNQPFLQIDQIASFFTCRYKFLKIRSCGKIFLVEHGQNIGVAYLVSGV